jgi:hypothetical protein
MQLLQAVETLSPFLCIVPGESAESRWDRDQILGTSSIHSRSGREKDRDLQVL